MNEKLSARSRLGRGLQVLIPKTIRARLFLLLLSFFGTILLIGGSVLFSLQQQKNDAPVINIAGRQRMLSQQMSKEMFQLLGSTGVQANEVRTSLGQTIALFDRSLDGLKTGDEELRLPPTTDPAILAQIAVVESIWAPFQQNIRTVMSRGGSGELDPATAAAARHVEENNTRLLAETNNTVQLYEDAASEKISTLLNALLGGTLLAFVLFLLGLYISQRMIAHRLQLIKNAVAALAAGQYSERVDVLGGQDEIADMATDLNHMLDEIVGLIQTKDQGLQMEQAIMKLLDEISDVADGDLRAEAEVTETITGAIADSFNNMIDELRDIIANVNKTTAIVQSSALEVSKDTEELAAGSARQAEQIDGVSKAVGSIALTTKRVSEDARRSADVARDALERAVKGADVVGRTVGGMNSMRERVQETSKRIKRLGESSQEIGEIIQLISDIADRTSILALNASIQAAMAGDAGRGFGVVAGEVERLAERSAQATNRISALVTTIQNETMEASSAMEETTREVVASSALAMEAGAALQEIENYSKQLAELVTGISSASAQQAEMATDVNIAMVDITAVTKTSMSAARGAAASVSGLAEVTTGLRRSLERFKLPEVAA